MRVCYFGTYRKEYSRNRIMISSLRKVGVDVVECHETLWNSIEDRVIVASGGWKNPKFIIRVIKAYFNLLVKYFKIKDFDVLVVGYPGHFDIFLAKILSLMKSKPLVWDVLMSIYLVSKERGLDQRSSFTIKMIKFVERWACNSPDKLIIESKHYANWFSVNQGVAVNRFAYVPLGADENIFHTQDTIVSESTISENIKVLYYGNFLPSHGVDKIIAASKLLLSNPNIKFFLIGDGPTAEEMRFKTLGQQNVSFLGHLSQEQLLHQISTVDICLGVFGTTGQSLMTIQNKIFECIAVGKPVLTGVSEPILETFTHGVDLFICQREPKDIASHLLVLAYDPDLRAKIAQGGLELFKNRFSFESIGGTFLGILEKTKNDYIRKKK